MSGCCRSLKGFIKDCNSSMGGIRRAWIACWSEVQTPTVEDDMITALGGTGNTSWYEYEFIKNTGSVTSTFNQAGDAGTSYVESVIVLQFTKQETAKRIEINNLAVSDVAVIIEDANHKFWYFGFDDYVTLTDGTAETGTARADFNGYNISLTDESEELPYELSQSAINQLLGVVTP